MTHQELPSYDQAPAGAIRFNTDSRKLEVYCGGPVGFGTTTITGAWFQIDSFTPDTATGGTRGLIGGGASPSISGYDDINYINIATTGNAQDFGTLTEARRNLGALASSTRGVWAGGAPTLSPSPARTQVDYVTIASTGAAIDFGANLGTGRRGISGCSNSTRGLFAGGFNDTSPSIFYNIIDYITIQSTGSVLDFGDLTVGRSSLGSCSSSTRGVWGGGQNPANLVDVDFVTISTLGNAADFGDLLTAAFAVAASSNAIRGIFGGGSTPDTVNRIEYITISTSGTAVDFGDLTSTRGFVGSCSSSTRGVFTGGYGPASPSVTNTIDYVTIMSTGNAVDFGDMIDSNSGNKSQNAACSNGHGGL